MIKTKRWNDPVDSDDGTRILITRYRPRALPKSEETWTQWITAVAPSKELLADFHGKGRVPTTWNEYRVRYIKEMRQQKEAIEALAHRSKNGETITLLCSKDCIRESRCHRSLLKDLIEKAEAEKE